MSDSSDTVHSQQSQLAYVSALKAKGAYTPPDIVKQQCADSPSQKFDCSDSSS